MIHSPASVTETGGTLPTTRKTAGTGGYCIEFAVCFMFQTDRWTEISRAARIFKVYLYIKYIDFPSGSRPRGRPPSARFSK